MVEIARCKGYLCGNTASSDICLPSTISRNPPKPEATIVFIPPIKATSDGKPRDGNEQILPLSADGGGAKRHVFDGEVAAYQVAHSYVD